MVPRDSKSLICTTINLQPASSAAEPKQLAMSIVETKFSDFNGSKHFSSLDFCPGYGHCPLHPGSFEAYGIVSLQETFVSTSVFYKLKEAAAYFQFTTLLLFGRIRNQMKAGTDNFKIHTETGTKLLNYLEIFFQNLRPAQYTIICSKSVRFMREA